MYLGKLIKSARREHQKISVNNICFDSRKIKKKDIFFAIKGSKTAGNKFLNNVISKGASAIISNSKVKNKNYKIPIYVVKDVRKSLSEACSKFYKKKPNHIIAVTGTNGKSSVANFFYQILKLINISAASIGTLGISSKNFNKKTNLTTMDPLSLHRNLQILSKKKINHVILEASSQGLEQKRLDNLNIKIGIFTNLSHDHLDYHKDMKSYLNSKMYLFKNLLKKNSIIITDEENKEFNILKNIARKRKIKKITIGKNSGNIKVIHHRNEGNNQIIKILVNSQTFLLEIPLIGFFQIKNLLMAILASRCCGLSYNQILKKINKIKPVPGRLECVANLKNNSNIIVDFAHTPDALEKSLVALKKQFGKKIILVFGCGGERDIKKRFGMGKIAKKYCRKIFVTDDNPRNEDPKKIRRSIIKSCKELAIDIGNRKQAIKKAIEELKSNEILLVAGKGHEETQDYGKKIINFSDKRTIRQILKKHKFFRQNKNWEQEITQEVFNNKNYKKINYRGVSINSKTIKKNNLFFALKGKNTDGHKYVKSALKKGAAKCVVSKKINLTSKNKVIKVKNTFVSLNYLAKITREKTLAKIIGITGSVGKTTLKNLSSFALKNYGRVYSSPLSYNNKFGVPLSVSNIKENTQFGIFEIGLSKKGEIDQLSKIVKPQIGIITNISEAHIENFKNLKEIANAKSEIIQNISKNGKLILNKENKFFSFFSSIAKKRGIEVISFGRKKGSDIHLSQIKRFNNFYKLKIIINNKIFFFNIKYRLKNFVDNILACITMVHALNLDLNKIKARFVKFKIPEGRGDIKIIKKFNKKFRFIDESYNANPLSVVSAIKNMEHFSVKKNAKKMIFLGDMLELGKKSKKLHRSLSIPINASDIDKVFVYGSYIKETFNSLSKAKKGKVFNNLDEAYHHFGKIIRNYDLLMVKGSNATGLNQFSKNIKRGHISAL